MNHARTQVGETLKRIRETRGITLSELARLSGVAKGTLSTLEAGDANPTLDTLWALSNVLHVSLGELVTPAPTPVNVVRAGDGVFVEGGTVKASLLDQMDVDRIHLEFFQGTVEEGTQVSLAHAPGVVEHIFVTGGRVRVGPEDQPVALETGDYLRMEASRPHLYEGIDGPANLVLVMQYPR